MTDNVKLNTLPRGAVFIHYGIDWVKLWTESTYCDRYVCVRPGNSYSIRMFDPDELVLPTGKIATITI